MEMQAEILKRLYEGKKNTLEEGYLDAIALQRHRERLTAEVINRWKSSLNKPTLPGKRVRNALVPQLYGWINRPHERLTYKTTQIITGHGCFSAFLYMIGK